MIKLKAILATVLFLFPVSQAGSGQEPKPGPSPDTVAIKAKALLKQGKINAAIKDLAAALDKAPGNLKLHLTMAQALYLRGVRTFKENRAASNAVLEDMGMAEEEAQAVLAVEANNRDARMVLAQAVYYQGRPDEAIAAAQAILAIDGNDGGANFLVAEILFSRSGQQVQAGSLNQAKDLRKKAAAAYRKAIKARKKIAQCYRRLGDIVATDGKLDRALGHYRKSLSRDASQAPHFWLLQTCPALKGNKLYRDCAAARLKAGDKSGAGLLTTYAGYYLERARDWKGARVAALKAYDIDPEGQWAARYRAGWCSWWLEDRKQAEKIFLQLVRNRRKQFCDHLRAIGAEGKTAAAMMHALASDAVSQNRRGDGRDLSLLLAVVRGAGEDWNNYAFLCRETGKYEDAWVGYQRAITKEPNDPVYLNDGALILQYHLQRNLKYAKQLYERAVKQAQLIIKDPNSKPGDVSRARVALRDARNNLRRL